MNGNWKFILGMLIPIIGFAIGYGAIGSDIEHNTETNLSQDTWIRSIEQKQNSNHIELLRELGEIKARLPK